MCIVKMAALMQSVKLARRLTSHNSALRCFYHPRRNVANLNHHVFLRTEIKMERLVSVISRQSSTIVSERAIIESEQGRLHHDSPTRPPTRPNFNPNEAQQQSLPELLQGLRDVRAGRGRVLTPGMLIRVLREIGNDSMTLTDRDTAFILQCAGRNLTTTPKKERAALLKRMIEKYEELGITLTTEHYNAILQANLENGTDFNPIEILAKMEGAGVAANGFTYRLFIAKFCEDGNVDAASEILQHMKQSSIPVGEHIFSSFITGYMKNGDVDKAKQILEVMSASGIEPTGLSYASFLKAYAVKGDLDGMKTTLTEAEERRLNIYSEHLFDSVMLLAEGGHQECMSEVLSEIASRDYQENSLIQRSLRELVTAGHEDIAVQLFHRFNRNNPNTILMPLVAQRKPFDAFVAVTEKLGPLCYSKENVDVLAKFITRLASPVQGVDLEILHLLHNKSAAVDAVSVRQMLSRLGNTSVESLYKVAEILCIINSKSAAAMVNDVAVVASHLLQHKENCDDVAAKLQGLGFAEQELPLVIFLGYLRSGQFPLAAEYGKTNSTKLGASKVLDSEAVPLRDFLLKGYNSAGRAKNLSDLLDIIQQCNEILPMQPHRVNSDVFLRFISRKNPRDIEKYMQLCEEKEMKILPRYRRTILKELGAKQMPQDVVSRLDQLVPAEVKVPNLTELQTMPTAELEQLLALVKENRNLLHISNISKTLIRRYCAEPNAENRSKIDELAQLMESNQSSYDFLSLKALLLFNATVKKDLPASMKYFKQVTERYRQYRDTFLLVLQVATLQAQTGLETEAFNIVREHLENATSNEEFTKSKALAVYCVRLLNSLQNREDIDNMYELLVKGYVPEQTFSVMTGLIRAHIRCESAEAVLQDLRKFNTEQKFTPNQDLLGEILRFMMTKNDDASVKELISIVTASKGAMFSQQVVIKEYLSLGRIEEARQAIEEQEDLTMPIMNRICAAIFRENGVEAMTELVNMSKDMKGVEREQMIFWLIKMHVKQKNSSAALDAFVMYQEENITPAKHTLRLVDKLLTSLNVNAVSAEMLEQAPEAKPKELKEKPVDAMETKETVSH